MEDKHPEFIQFETDLVLEWWDLGGRLDLLTEDDVLDVWMLRGPLDWTGGRVIELIDWRQSDGTD